MGFNILKTNLKPGYVLDLLEKLVKLPSVDDIAKADEIEKEEFFENTENFISKMSQTDDDLFGHPLCELLGLDKQLKSITVLLKVEVAKKVKLEEKIQKEKSKLEEFREYLGVYGDDQREEIKNRTERLSDDLKAKQESIDLLKSKLANHITSFKETITNLSDKDTSLADKIRMLFKRARHHDCFHTHVLSFAEVSKEKKREKRGGKGRRKGRKGKGREGERGRKEEETSAI